MKQEEFNRLKSNSDENSTESLEFKEPQIFVNELLRLQSDGLIDGKMVHDQILTMIVGVITVDNFFRRDCNKFSFREMKRRL